MRLFDIVRAAFGLLGVVYFHTSSISHIFGTDVSFQVPLFNMFPFSSATAVTVIAVLHLFALLAFIAGYKVAISGIVAGLTRFIILFAHLDGVLAFSYFLPLGWIAFSFVAMTEGGQSSKANFILPFFLGSVFVTSGFQKLVRINDMGLKMPYELGRFFRPEFLTYCQGGLCLTAMWALYVIVIFELLIGSTIWWPGTRKINVFLHFLFCIFLYTAVSLRFVGVLLFFIQLAVSLRLNPWTVRDIARLRPTSKQIGGAIAVLVSYGLLTTINAPWAALLSTFVESLILFLPMLLICEAAQTIEMTAADSNMQITTHHQYRSIEKFENVVDGVSGRGSLVMC